MGFNNFSEEKTSRLIKISMGIEALNQKSKYLGSSMATLHEKKLYCERADNWKREAELYVGAAKEFLYIPEIKESVEKLKEIYSEI